MPEYIPQCDSADTWQLFNKLADIDIAEITRHYLICAEWLDLNEDIGNPLPDNWAGFSTNAICQAFNTCTEFVTQCFKASIDFESLATLYDENCSGSYDLKERLGHDIWLTSNRHGAGFWDRGLGDVGKQLTDIAHNLGECFAYIGDNGFGELS